MLKVTGFHAVRLALTCGRSIRLPFTLPLTLCFPGPPRTQQQRRLARGPAGL